MAQRMASITKPASGKKPDRQAARDRVFSRERVVLFALSMALYTALGLYLQHLDIYVNDALSRTSAASSVLFSRDPHLAAIGFVWNPLPSFLQVPLVAMLHVLHVDVIVAGPLLSAAFAAATLVVLHMLMQGAGFSPNVRWLLVGLYGLNPMVLLYAANGMSESLFIFLVVVVTAGFLRWVETESLGAFLTMVTASMLALQTRYEALAFTAMVGGCLVAMLAVRARKHRSSGEIRRVEAYLSAYTTGTAYSFGAWVFLSWMIMADPFYFLNSIYGNAAQTKPFRTEQSTFLSSAVGSIWGSVRYGLEQSLWLFPAAAPIVLLTIGVAMRRRDASLVCMLAIAATIPVFQVVMVYSGQSFGWLRFFMYSIPFSYLLSIALRKSIPAFFTGWRGRFAIATLVALLLLSNLASWFAMDDAVLGREEKYVTCKILHRDGVSTAYSLERWRLLNAYIEALPPGKVLVDVFLGYPLVLVANDPTRYVITSDRDFEQAASHPSESVSYVLVPRPVGLGESDFLNRAYPELWGSGSDELTLVATFEQELPGLSWAWKLFEVAGHAGDAQDGTAYTNADIMRQLREFGHQPGATWC